MEEKSKRGRPPGSKNKKASDSVLLTGTEIYDIIKLCSDRNVLSFHYRDLSVNFNKETCYKVEEKPEVTRKIDLRRRDEQVHEELDYLKLTDPVGYESLAMEGEVENEETDYRGAQPTL